MSEVDKSVIRCGHLLFCAECVNLANLDTTPNSHCVTRIGSSRSNPCGDTPHKGLS